MVDGEPDIARFLGIDQAFVPFCEGVQPLAQLEVRSSPLSQSLQLLAAKCVAFLLLELSRQFENLRAENQALFDCRLQFVDLAVQLPREISLGDTGDLAPARVSQINRLGRSR